MTVGPFRSEFSPFILSNTQSRDAKARSRSLIKRLYSGADHLLHPQYNGVRDSNTLVFSNSDDDLSVHPGYEIRIAMDAVKNMLNAYTQENPKRISVTTITDETKAPRHLSTAGELYF